ncbi:MAG TPA: DUF3276 family protein [Salinivirgaceae bacterium]|nr:DUF3276 family protein [Salinivirgaceae bacterium]
MERDFEKGGGEIYSKAVKAGKRTYFFDVKSTRKNDFYVTITESKKRFDADGGFSYEKHKIFLYKEDFAKFRDGLKDVFDFIQANFNFNIDEDNKPNVEDDLSFDDLDK